MLKKLFAGLLMITFINVFTSDAKAMAMISPDEVLSIVVEMLEVFESQEETLKNDDDSIFKDKTFDDSLGQYANPAEMGESVKYHYFVRHDDMPVPLDMNIQANILTGDEAYQSLGMNEAYQVIDQMNEREEWIVIDFELEIIDDGEYSEATHELHATDFDLYLVGSPDTMVYNPLYNDNLFESVVLQPGDVFEGKVAKRVPKYTDITVRFGTGDESGHVFWYFYAEEDPNIIY